MRVIWRRGGGTVDDVRRALPKPHQGAYTTVQTILNRLVDRGLLKRTKTGKAFTYSANVSEADYLAGSLDRALAGASQDARRAALATLMGELDAVEAQEIQALADEIGRKRRSR